MLLTDVYDDVFKSNTHGGSQKRWREDEADQLRAKSALIPDI